MNKQISVLMSVYKNDDPNHLRRSIESILNQTLPPTEVIIVVDGPVETPIMDVITEFEDNPLINCIRLPENVGLGLALAEGMKYCKYNFIARMDSDDVARLDRFELQMNCFDENPDLDIVGSNISEFIGEESNIVSYRNLPECDKDIKLFMKYRCGFNHMTVMFKKSSVLSVGGYKDLHYNEDYYLWVRMQLANLTFANISKALVNVRIGEDMYARRGGMKYFKSELFIQNYMLKNRIISPFVYCSNVLKRFIVQICLPNDIRAFVFKKFARN